MVSSQEVLIRDLFSILEREVGIQSYKVIVVFTTARLTGVLAEMFNSVSAQTGYKALLETHSRNTQKQRERSSEQFRKQRNAILFSSDVTACRMDNPSVTSVLLVGLTDRGRSISTASDGRPALGRMARGRSSWRTTRRAT